MTAAATCKKIKALEKLRLPELWKQFAEQVGETTRSPNKKYLIRRISEALETADSEASASAATLKRPAKPKAPQGRKASKPAAVTKKAAAKKINTAAMRAPKKNSPPAEASTVSTPLSKLSIADLQARYRDIVGRPTGSKHRAYLQWKIRQAQKGVIPVGPSRRRSNANPSDFKVIPLRMETEVVAQIDAARERLDLPSRTALIRRALMLYLAKAGENDVAALLDKGK
jgi:Ribbon-helix-helix protein, copG family